MADQDQQSGQPKPERRRNGASVRTENAVLRGDPGLNLVVCNIYPTEFFESSGHPEAGYLDERDRAINVDVLWDGEQWQFVREQPDGGYADKYQRLRECVQILRRGRYR